MSERQTLPVLALRNFVLFPGVAAPIQAGRPRTLKAIEVALAAGENPRIFAVSQREPKEDATAEDLHTIGTIARILQIQRGLNGMQLLIQGEERGIAVKITEHEDGYFQAVVRDAEEHPHENQDEPAFAGLYREAREKAAELGERSGLPGEVVQQLLSNVDDPGRLADLVAGYSEIPHAQKQMLLETLSVEERLRRVLIHVQRQINVIEAQEDIKSKVQEELGGRQREMFLREQLKAIQKELGEDGGEEQLEELREKLQEKELPEAVRTEVDRELGRLGRMNREAMESQVIRSFLETIAELPWSERSDDHLDLTEAEEILHEDHYGLEDVKDRVLEFLAVHQLREARRRAEEGDEAADADETDTDVPPVTVGEGTLPEGSFPEPVSAAGPAEEETSRKGPILLFVGPPGVGKTSVAKSI
ncbi:MAG TPA: LON peptidase substrate-binding domain-containing protein, partial [Thermoanaerobaculia bacterium]